MEKFVLLILSLVLFSSCSSVKIYHSTPPSEQALKEVSAFHVDRFQGEHSILFRSLLIREIYQLPHLNYLENYPENSNLFAALLNAKVKVYSIRDEEQQQPETQIRLVQHQMRKNKQSGGKLVKRAFEFVETPFMERTIHRTLDLEIVFMVHSVDNNQILFKSSEKASYQQSYTGEESILLIPDASDEMTRLGKLLIEKFLDRISPVIKNSVTTLETGTAPLPWSFGMLDLGHPRIIRANRFAAGGRYDVAIKNWNYVLFEPRTYLESENFIFTNEVYTRLRQTNLPRSVMRPLLKLYGKSYSPKQIDTVLLSLISRTAFQRYAAIIKSHSRSSKNYDRLNLAASHYNLGEVHRLQNTLELAAYHFAQANAYNPNEKYAQSWTDVQHEMGDYNPLDTLMDRTIAAAGHRPPPESAMLQPSSVKILSAKVELGIKPEDEDFDIKPIELSPLKTNLQSQEVSTVSETIPADQENVVEPDIISEPKSLAPLELD